MTAYHGHCAKLLLFRYDSTHRDEFNQEIWNLEDRSGDTTVLQMQSLVAVWLLISTMFQIPQFSTSSVRGSHMKLYTSYPSLPVRPRIKATHCAIKSFKLIIAIHALLLSVLMMLPTVASCSVNKSTPVHTANINGSCSSRNRSTWTTFDVPGSFFAYFCFHETETWFLRGAEIHTQIGTLVSGESGWLYFEHFESTHFFPNNSWVPLKVVKSQWVWPINEPASSRSFLQKSRRVLLRVMELERIENYYRSHTHRSTPFPFHAVIFLIP